MSSQVVSWGCGECPTQHARDTAASGCRRPLTVVPQSHVVVEKGQDECGRVLTLRGVWRGLGEKMNGFRDLKVKCGPPSDLELILGPTLKTDQSFCQGQEQSGRIVDLERSVENPGEGRGEVEYRTGRILGG